MALKPRSLTARRGSATAASTSNGASMYRSQRSGGSMMWMSLSRTRNPLCAMMRFSSRCRGRLTPRAPHDTPPGTVGHLLEAALLVLRGDPDGLGLHAHGKDLCGQ